MKSRIFAFALGVAGSLSVGLYGANATFEVSAGISIQSPSDFYQPLAANGAWIQVGNFGRCWHPAVTAEWRPYCTGYWEWTDCGWYWVSDEPWAWACYHYGTWAYDATDGWVWVPGTEWAPAWVNWRTSDGYIGWAPCGPSGLTIDASSYVFVQSDHFNDHLQPNKVIMNNPGLISRTSEIRNVGREQRDIGGRMQTVVVNNGPDVGMVEKATKHTFEPVSIQKADQTTFRNAPAEVQRLAKQPREQPATTQPESRDLQRPTEQNQKNGQLLDPNRGNVPDTTPRENPAVPRNYQRDQDLPTERNTPAERPLPGTLPEELPKTPSQRVIPPGNNELPANHGEREKQIVPPGQAIPPGQAPRQAVPAAPPVQKAPPQDKDHQNGP